MASALRYMHDEASEEHVYICRDLKPDNIGFAADGTLKLFGKLIFLFLLLRYWTSSVHGIGWPAKRASDPAGRKQRCSHSVSQHELTV